MSSQNFRQQNPVRKISAAILGLLVVCSSGVAMANTVTQSLNFSLNPDGTTEVLHFQPFDLSLGTLQSVAISFDATRRHDWAVWNISGQPAAVDYEASLTGTTLILDGTGFGFADLPYGSGNTGTLGSVSLPDFFTEFQAGRNQFMAGLDPDYPSAFHPESTLTAISGLYSPVGFLGDLDLSYDPGIEFIGGNNILTTSLVDVFGTASVIYTFEAVPDSPLGLALPVLLVGLFAWARLRRPGMKPVSSV